MISEAFSVLQSDEHRKYLTEFYKKYKNRFYAIAFSKLHNREAAEDAVQETFLRIADKREKFFQIDHNKRVAFTDVIIRNVSVDMFKKSRGIEEVELTENISDCDCELSLSEKILGEISKNELVECISKLPPLQRDILELNAYHGLSISEIAQYLSVSENVVRQRLFQARKTIKRDLEGKETNNV